MHRRMKNTEEIANVLAAVWGAKFIQIHASFFAKDDYEE